MIQFLEYDSKEMWDKTILAVWQIGGSIVPTEYRRAYVFMLWTLQSPICNRLLVMQIPGILHD